MLFVAVLAVGSWPCEEGGISRGKRSVHENNAEHDSTNFNYAILDATHNYGDGTSWANCDMYSSSEKTEAQNVATQTIEAALDEFRALGFTFTKIDPPAYWIPQTIVFGLFADGGNCKGGCSAYIGKFFSPTTNRWGMTTSMGVNLGWCYYLKSVVIHEIMHRLGFKHEQSSNFRDEFVVVGDNLKNDGDYMKASYFLNSSEYDPCSIMQYALNSNFYLTDEGKARLCRCFDYNRHELWETCNDINEVVGRPSYLSPSDIAGLNALYSLPPPPPPPTANWEVRTGSCHRGYALGHHNAKCSYLSESGSEIEFGEKIDDLEDCEEAARALQLKDTHVNNIQYTGVFGSSTLYGCYYNTGDYHEKRLHFSDSFLGASRESDTCQYFQLCRCNSGFENLWFPDTCNKFLTENIVTNPPTNSPSTMSPTSLPSTSVPTAAPSTSTPTNAPSTSTPTSASPSTSTVTTTTSAQKGSFIEIEYYVYLNKILVESEVNQACIELQSILAANRTSLNPFWDQNVKCAYDQNKVSLSTVTTAAQRAWLEAEAPTPTKLILENRALTVLSSGFALKDDISGKKSSSVILNVGVAVGIVCIILIISLLTNFDHLKRGEHLVLG